MTRWHFYFDEHVPEPIAEGLRRRHIAVLTTQEAGNQELLDEDQLAYAHELA